MPIYATTAQVAKYITGDVAGALPANVGRMIRKASGFVAYAVRGAVYAVDAEDLPVDAKKREALSEAVSAQVAAWVDNGVDPISPGVVEQRVASKSLGGASVTYEVDAGKVAYRAQLATANSLVGDAMRILDAAGMLTTNVRAAATGWGREYDITPRGTAVLGEAILGA